MGMLAMANLVERDGSMGGDSEDEVRRLLGLGLGLEGGRYVKRPLPPCNPSPAAGALVACGQRSRAC
jgi:hypothetical protein